jgi:hypothetical protein
MSAGKLRWRDPVPITTVQYQAQAETKYPEQIRLL